MQEKIFSIRRTRKAFQILYIYKNVQNSPITSNKMFQMKSILRKHKYTTSDTNLF